MAKSKNCASPVTPCETFSRISASSSPDSIALSKVDGFDVSPVTEHGSTYRASCPEPSILRVMLSSQRLCPSLCSFSVGLIAALARTFAPTADAATRPA